MVSLMGPNVKIYIQYLEITTENNPLKLIFN